MSSRSTEHWALYYLARGWSVIPVRPQDKRARLPWQDYQQRLAGEQEVKEWLQRWPDTNLAIVTGSVSSLVVLDIDPQHGGEESLSRLEETHGRLPRTLETLTGGGGRHLYFVHPGGTIPNRAGLARGIDLRGDGGYIIAPPSMHSSGRRYIWKPAHGPEETALARMPDWLINLIHQQTHRAGHSISHWRQLVKEGVEEGERNNTIASLTGHLLWHGVDPYVALDLLLCWNAARCHPPLSDDEVAKTVASITRLHRQHTTQADES